MLSAPAPAEVATVTRGLACWLEIDLDAIGHNVRSIVEWVGPRTRVAAVVKAQAYGMGAVPVAEAAVRAGAERLAVARVHEGVSLRRAGVTAPILVLSRTDPSEAEEVAAHALTPTVDDSVLVDALDRAARQHGVRLAVHVKVDTGLHRFGVAPSAVLPLTQAIGAAAHIEAEGLWTHFASADESDLSSAVAQIRLFERVTADLGAEGFHFPIRHAANSAATVSLPSGHFDLVRVGQAMYGVRPLDFTGRMPDLRPAVALRARVARLMELGPGDAVGYGETWRAERPTRAATLTAGYADGFPRVLSNQGAVSIHGHRAPILGRVMMDHLVVDVSGIPDVAPGSEATLFGPGGRDIWDVAHEAGTIPHELLVGIGGRVPRVYVENERVVSATRLDGSDPLKN